MSGHTVKTMIPVVVVGGSLNALGVVRSLARGRDDTLRSRANRTFMCDINACNNPCLRCYIKKCE